jgi:hypothetical protein|tara:strand:+ start:142 stop:351 length:210 start_codon:yes stop_codon:yes gene_type:complete
LVSIRQSPGSPSASLVNRLGKGTIEVQEPNKIVHHGKKELLGRILETPPLALVSVRLRILRESIHDVST